ncbi:helicase superfamily c-terminal domain [Rhizoctonia solani]|uniref:RNA helicase n=1 Tax=Rhizoctonia solani TaxID=456999 RepID=A0A8H7HJQ0_9AGAM|nr:helicase superfamily c-terminal domain [Rhizoctonia solani]
MLRHRLQQDVCSKSFRECLINTHYRYISGSSLNATLRPRRSPPPLLTNPGTNRLFNHSVKPPLASRGEEFPRSTSRIESSSSSVRSKKFSPDKFRTVGPGRREGRSYLDRPDERNSGNDFKPRHRDSSRKQRIRRPQGGLGDYIYDNYKPRTPTPSSKKPQNVQSPSQMDPSFDVLSSIKSVFPHVEKPTQVQGRLIPAIMQGHDIILMDETGSGKTFGSVLALLPEIARPHTGITTLYIVPHRDLAYQIESWCQKLVTSQPSTSIDPSTVVRVIARPNTTPQIFAQIRNNPPRILVSTPGALVDAMTSGQLQLKTTLRRIIVDEVDEVMKIPLRYHKVQLRNYHTPEAAQAIDKLLRLMWEGRRPKPQMVMMSATLTLHVRSWLFKQNGWMSERVVRIHGIQEKIESGEFESSERTLVTHSAVVVEADGRLRNLNEEDQEADSSSEEGERGILSGDPEAILGLLDREGDGATLGSRPGPTYQLPTRLAKGITLPPSILEAVATSVALDVSHRALLVIPNGVSIGPVVEALRELGVEARTLNLKDEIEHVSNRLENEQEVHSKPSSATTSSDRSLAEDEGEDFVSNPTLLVATTTAVRGIDIPTLSHVYIVGGLESEEIYRHVAGRAGRFGMPGTVISFVGADEAEKLVGGTGERRIRKIFERIGVSNVPFPHI